MGAKITCFAAADAAPVDKRLLDLVGGHGADQSGTGRLCGVNRADVAGRVWRSNYRVDENNAASRLKGSFDAGQLTQQSTDDSRRVPGQEGNLYRRPLK